MTDHPDESSDLQAIRRDIELRRSSVQVWERLYPDGDRFRREFDQLAEAAQDWQAATGAQRFRAKRILVQRFGREDAYLLMLMAAPKSNQSWLLRIRTRKDNEKSDGGRRDREAQKRHLDYVVCSEIYERMMGGQSKAEAITAVKEDYRTGAPYPSNGLLPPLNRFKRQLPESDAIEKWLKRFRSDARRRGYVDPFAALSAGPTAREPDLKLSDIPSRGRPRKNR